MSPRPWLLSATLRFHKGKPGISRFENFAEKFGEALRKALPLYAGLGMTVFRGDGWINRVRRTYGLSWSTRKEVAAGFALSRRNLYQDGSCLLAAIAPPEAIICVPSHSADDRFEEAEVLIDRRLLQGVRMIKRHRPEGR